MSQRKTQNSQRAGTIRETLQSFTHCSPSAQGPSNVPQGSPAPSDFVLNSPIPTIPEDNEVEGNLQGAKGHSDHEGDQEQDCDSDNDQALNRAATVPPPDSALARSLELLANKIASIPNHLKTSSSIKIRVPDIFDSSDLNKLETFKFQCSMYLATCKRNFPD